LQPSLIRTHYSAGRVAALVSMPPHTRSAAQTRHLDAFLRFCPKAHQLRRFVLQFRAMLRWRNANKLCTALVQIAEFGRVHWSFGELRTSDEQAEQHRRAVCRPAL
jgi:hypothetical protein